MATRERVLAAARDLFEEMGYEPTTIRMVAQRAGVSVGSVFTSFTGKAELLSQVMQDRLEALYAELEQLAPHLRGPTVDRLRSIMAVHYGFETRRVRLFMVYIGASFLWEAGQAIIPLGRNHRLKSMLVDTLKGGVERGEVRADADIEVFVETLMAAYIWNYRLAHHDGAGAPALIAAMDRQIGLLFDGVAARPPAGAADRPA
jgi:TetR/AcrR family transcriptional regulator, cholesterol catabolism regulator